jgi:hypothetical protein
MAAALFECDSEKLASAIVLQQKILSQRRELETRNVCQPIQRRMENLITTKMRAFFFCLILGNR